jgi:hypothetical protein
LARGILTIGTKVLDHHDVALEPPDLGDLERGVDAGPVDL